MRICFADDGSERWVTYTAAQYGEDLRGRCTIWDGPSAQAKPVKKQDLRWNTRVVALDAVKDAVKGKMPKAIQDLWSKRFGPVQQDPIAAEKNRKRRANATEHADRKGDPKKVRTSTKKADQKETSKTPRKPTKKTPSAQAPSQKTAHGLDDAALQELYHDFNQPFPEDGLSRLASLIQGLHKTPTKPPTDLLREIRISATDIIKLDPKLVWEIPEFMAWKKEDMRLKKEQDQRAPTPYRSVEDILREMRESMEARHRDFAALEYKVHEH
jgi:hypothetical protein